MTEQAKIQFKVDFHKFENLLKVLQKGVGSEVEIREVFMAFLLAECVWLYFTIDREDVAGYNAESRTEIQKEAVKISKLMQSKKI